jgi:hypothetical protein
MKVQANVIRSKSMIHTSKMRIIREVPSLRITGKWLQDAGIFPGDEVYLYVTSEKVEIRKNLRP